MHKENNGMKTKDESKQEGWRPSQAEETLRGEERSLDIGESGQFAPGGHYNQEGVNEPRRTLNEDDISRRRAIREGVNFGVGMAAFKQRHRD